MSVVHAWILLSVLGLAVSLFLANESRLDLSALPKVVNGRRTIAWARLLREASRATIHGAYIVAGLSALDILPFREALVPILMYGNAALVAHSIIDARARRVLFATRNAEPPIPHP